MRWLALILPLLFLAGCGGGTVKTRETGYKGKARLDAYLAATRFLERMDYKVINRPGWPDLDYDAAMLIVPASVLSTDAYVREVAGWVSQGGHLLCLVEHAESYHNDWFSGSKRRLTKDDDPYPEALEKWLGNVGLKLTLEDDKRFTEDHLTVDGGRYEVFTEATVGVRVGSRSRHALGQTKVGEGLVTVMTDARPFRNRYIDEHEHAALLLALADASPYEGCVIIVRDAGLSLWTLLWEHFRPALFGLLAVTVFWLWKNMPRFGPLRREESRSNLRDYDHHLEALGDFQWRLDRGAAMLRPLRDLILERAHRQAASLHRDGDLFEWIGRRAGIPRERAERAMTHQNPGDPTSFTRLVTDLQLIHHSLS
ncbi:DUF4350 domain-containing protein [Luteolibacter marinus]|uniref:DUF4350 domain-containing protein n=1 Tax=Luteolibacter marinus TaxID=2776705 RepID=UPI001868346D|nr:DUF4350 domain-containing protein [Luteolibacter marinus]